MSMLRMLFALDTPVNRRRYLLTGVVLVLVKYAVDAALVWAATGRLWTPYDYLNPIQGHYPSSIDEAPGWMLGAMMVWALPFLWIGASMTLRRAVDAGRPAALGLVYFVPLVGYALMFTLCVLPSRPRVRRDDGARLPRKLDRRYRSALAGIGLGLGIAAVMLGVSVYLLGDYGSALFWATPVVVGAAAGYVHNRPHPRTLGETAGVAWLTVVLAGGAAVLLAAEGVLCVLMAAPPAFVGALLGAWVGRAMALDSGTHPAHVALMFLALPLLAGAAPPARDLPVREVVSAVDIDAPPERVWSNVIGFGTLPPPPEWVFRAGIAYPVGAHIDGAGVGAVRRCEFSTGAFVEPITRWEPGRVLGFDVAAQPQPMTELSPYRDLHPPHLDGYLRSRKGEFRLTELPGGRTHLEGSTWYTLDMAPSGYWALWTDALIHAIHLRVLAHVRALSEKT